jgi:hypothetical protein
MSGGGDAAAVSQVSKSGGLMFEIPLPTKNCKLCVLLDPIDSILRSDFFLPAAAAGAARFLWWCAHVPRTT